MGLMLSTFANVGVKLAWLFKVGRAHIQPMWRTGRRPISKTTYHMAWSTSASNLIALVSGFAPMIFIADRYGVDALEQYGLVVATLYLPATLLGQAIGQVYYQRACRLHGEGQVLATLLVETSRNVAKIGIPLYAFFALIAPLAYPMVFGAQWESAGEMARWLCIAAGTAFISTPLDRTSIVVKAWRYLACRHSIRALSTCIVLLGVIRSDLDLRGCVSVLSVQMVLIYLVDYFSSYWFAHCHKKNEHQKC